VGESKASQPRAQAVADSIRLDILSGRLAPGSRLGFSELSANHRVSVGVLREALVRLVDRGIVRAQSNLGFTVMSLSDENLDDLTNIRAMTEPCFARESVRDAPVEWESAVVAAHHLLARTPVSGESREGYSGAWMSAHASFHVTLVCGTGSARMPEMVGRLRDEADLYCRWYTRGQDILLSAARTAQEHREIVEAATDRDTDRVERLLREHIVRSAEDPLGHGYWRAALEPQATRHRDSR
jgi:DNA-binding GntR family transcriptional regulator